VQRGSFRSFAQYLPFYRWVLLRDLLNDPLTYLELDDAAKVAQGGDKEAQALLQAI